MQLPHVVEQGMQRPLDGKYSKGQESVQLLLKTRPDEQEVQVSTEPEQVLHKGLQGVQVRPTWTLPDGQVSLQALFFRVAPEGQLVQVVESTLQVRHRSEHLKQVFPSR